MAARPPQIELNQTQLHIQLQIKMFVLPTYFNPNFITPFSKPLKLKIIRLYKKTQISKDHLIQIHIQYTVEMRDDLDK